MAINDVANTYPAFAQFASIPELQALWYNAGLEHWTQDQFQQKLWATDWWKSHSAASRQATALQLADPAEFNTRYNELRQKLQNIAYQEGLPLSGPALDYITGLNIFQGNSDDQLRAAIVAHATPGAGGEVDSVATQVKKLASDFGLPVSDQWAFGQAQGIRTTGGDLNGVTELLRTQAMAHYSNLAPQLEQGFTVRQIAEPYLQTAGNLLEIDPATIDLSDPRWTRPLSSAGADGKVTQMSLADWQKTVMQDPSYGWDRTNNAKKTAFDLRDQLAQTMGARA